MFVDILEFCPVDGKLCPQLAVKSERAVGEIIIVNYERFIEFSYHRCRRKV